MTPAPPPLSRRAVLAGLGASALAPAARGELRFELRGGQFTPFPIAVSDFVGEPEGEQIARVVINNLQRSGYFAPVDPAAFVEKIADPDAVPKFENWKAINAQALVTGRVAKDSQGRLNVTFRLWDVFAGEQAAGQRYGVAAKDWRRIGHLVSDAVWERIIGEKGHFDTRVVFVDETGAKETRRKRVALMDQDGANTRFVTGGADIVFSPRFSPDNKRIAYTAQPQGGQARVVIHDLATNQRESLAVDTFGPRFSADGARLIMSRQTGGATGLALYDIASKQLSKLTDAAAIDTSASFSPDGAQIVFESDRGGRQQIYVMPASGGQPKRVSFAEGIYSTPVWSPKGDLIAFTRRKGGSFAIGVMRPDGSGERLLADGFHNEGPTWSPNGRFIMFFRDPGGNSGSRIYMADVTGRVEMPVPTPSFGSDPDWGPRQG